MRRAVLAAALTLAFGLAACATTTPYQPLAAGSTVSGGYSEQKLDDAHWRISFKGNYATPRAVVETYLLYHAAELTIAQGGDWFELAGQRTHDVGRSYIEPAHPSFYGWPGIWGDPWMNDFDVVHDDAFEASAVIAIGRSPKPADDTRALDARQVLQNLAPKIVRPH